MKKVITYGTFDLFHQGHYNLLKRAKELGDYLIVGITTEQYDESRGKLNIQDSLLKRLDNVRETGFADEIIVEDHEGQKVEDIQKYNIDIFTVGSDWRGKFDYLNSYCDVVYLERTKDISSSERRIARNPILQLGMIGTGRIAHRFVGEARAVSGITVRNVYNPHIDSAVRFGDEFSLNTATDDLDRFFEDIDAVYVASPHETHYQYVKASLLAGKHVLCEKPLVFWQSEAEELFGIARDRKLILMEGIKTAYLPGFQKLMGVVKSGAIGEIRDVEACFTRLTPPNKREMTDAAYGGAFTEFASYSLLPIIKLLGRDYKEIRFDSIKADNGIDLYTKTSIIYDHGFALAKNGVGVKSEGQLVIAGTGGYILAESPWWLTKSFEVRFEDSSKVEKFATKYLGYGLRYEISDFVTMIGLEDKSKIGYKLTRGDSIVIAGIMEKFLGQRKQESGIFAND